MSEIREGCYCGVSCIQSGSVLRCRTCGNAFHPGCLRTGKPSPLEGDVLFHLICEDCSPDKQEHCTRLKLQWLQVLTLVLYNLQLNGGGKCGFFRWREHICNFIEKHWSVLFGTNRKKTSTWYGTVAGTLSAGCPQYFVSGVQELKEAGWWALAKPLTPPFLDIDVQLSNITKKAKRKTVPSLRSSAAEEILDMSDLSEPGGSTSMQFRGGHRQPIPATSLLKEKRPSLQGSSLEGNCEKRQKVSEFGSGSPPSSLVKLEFLPTSDSDGLPWSSAKEESADSWFSEMDLKPNEALPQLLLKDEAEEYGNLDEIDIDPGSTSPVLPQSPRVDDLVLNIRDADCAEEGKPNVSMSAGLLQDPFRELDERNSTELHLGPNDCRDTDSIEDSSDESLAPLTPYEEIQLLRTLAKANDVTGGSPESRRLIRKLCVRQVKRAHNLPIFNLDYVVHSLTGGLTSHHQIQHVDEGEQFPEGHRILDRFQLNSNTIKIQSRQPITFAARLIGSEENRFESIISPYTARILKPFIWRDYESKPLKMKLLEEIVAHHNKRHSDSPDELHNVESHPIDYCYVRPQHIPSVNALCREFFWPGIDLSECLQYPDFSCVALYRRVVVGFAFMVPDVKYCEAYVSFIFTHPEWRRAGIASFMLYHLVQTCMGKDVTLHVSATNSALLLYQKFGFKVEEFIVDFYDKYYPIDSNDCKHAMFLRLNR